MSESRFDPLPLLHAPFLRRELLRRFALTGVGVASAPLLGTALQACGSSDSSGNLVAYAISRSPNVLNPPIHTLLIESTVFGLIFSGLVKPGQGGNFAPALAEDYQTLDGGMTYKFSLRQGLKFDDGQPLTAQDWKFTWQAYINPKTATSYLTGWDKIDQVETPDDRSVVIHMKQPYAAFMQNVATNPVLPQHILQADFNNLSKSSFNRQPVGCGAFRFKSWQTAAQITLEANQYYYQGRPKLDQFIFKIVPDSNTQINELQTGAVDLIDVTPAQWDKVKSLSGVNTSSYLDATANAMYYLIQLDEYDFLKEVKVRQALDYATPKQQFVTDLLKGLAEIAYTDQVPDSPYYNPNVEKHDYNLEKAKSLLSEAGFTMQNGTLSRDGKPLEVPLYVLKTNPELVQLAQVLKERWSSIGIKTEVIPQESATLFGQGGPFYNGQDGAVIYSWGQGLDPDDFVNWDSSQIPQNSDSPGENGGHYSNPEIDELVRKGQVTTDFTARKKIYDRVQEILAHDVPAIFLAWPKALFGVNAKIQSFQPDSFQGAFWNVEKWTKSG